MPNHTTNKLLIRGRLSQVEALLKQGRATVDGEEKEFSLRGFVPPPDHPDYTAGSCGHRHPNPGLPPEYLRALGMDPQAMPKDDHSNCWYPWNRKNWGTKWDCYEVRILSDKDTVLDSLAKLDGEPHGGAAIYFDTAWSPPMPVIQEIVEMYPDLDIEFTFLDEGGGGGGRVTFKKGEPVEERVIPHDKNDQEFVKIAMDLKGYDPRDEEDEEDEEDE